MRHLQIKYHLVRCYVTLGDVDMVFCITEEMIADLLTKLVVGAQDNRLTVRFYSLFPESSARVLGFSLTNGHDVTRLQQPQMDTLE